MYIRVSIPAHSPAGVPAASPPHDQQRPPHDSPADEFLSVTLHVHNKQNPEASRPEDLIPQTLLSVLQRNRHLSCGRKTDICVRFLQFKNPG